MYYMKKFKMIFLVILLPMFGGVVNGQFVERPMDSYDYIIVGGGTAGSVIASRLSEDPDVTVLLLEQGGDDRGISTVTVPAFCQRTWTNPNLVRFYESEPLPNVYRHLLNGQAQWPRGTVLGGCSSVNNMAFVRGSRHDFDRWARTTRDETWDYRHVLPYFQKMETVTNPELKSSLYRGTHGPVGVTRSQPIYPLSDVIIEAFRELGYGFNEDYNGGSMEGVARTQHSVRDGERSSTSRAYVHPALQRKNLHVTIHARVDKIITSDQVAKGVVFVKSNQTSVTYARKEVIVSAGVIGSPKLLLLSGIGPRIHLKGLDISVVADLPVGKNLQDHLVFDLAASVNQSLGLTAAILGSEWAKSEYDVLRRGPLTLADSGVTFHTSSTDETKAVDWPDVKILFSLNPVTTATLRTFHYSPTLLEQLPQRDRVANGLTFWPMLMRPDSTGVLKLRSANPTDDPVIVPNYYKERSDVDAMMRAINVCKRLLTSASMVNIDARLIDVVHFNVCSQFPFDSDDYWACAVQARPRTLHHLSGTCKMGSADDPTAVVDSQLRVRGVTGLRVADASVMPYIVSANINAAVIMIGEKASDFIKGVSLPPTVLSNMCALKIPCNVFVLLLLLILLYNLY